MIDLFRSEVLKLRSTRTALGLLSAAVLVGVLSAVLVLAFVPAEGLEEDGAVVTVLAGATLVPLLGLVFGILSMTNEYRHGTITYSYLVTPRRWKVIAVKLVVCFVVGTTVLALVGLLLALVALIGYQIRGLDMDVNSITAGDAAKAIALILVTAGLMASFGVALGALLRNQPIAVAGTLIWALGVESTIFGLRPGVGQYLPFTAMEQVVSGALTVGPESDIGLTRPEAFVVSLAYIAVTSVAAVYTTMRRDVT